MYFRPQNKRGMVHGPNLLAASCMDLRDKPKYHDNYILAHVLRGIGSLEKSIITEEALDPSLDYIF